eukprot:11015005-Alexandrium_andersonii.AAC.1
MSASLVGSEMCIRDSFRCGALQSYAASPSWLNARFARLAMLPRSADVEPVSYTHLTLPTICSV